MRITLNAEIQPMFFLPNVFHLTWENPGPVEVDPSKLTPQQMSWIMNAEKKKVLVIDGFERPKTVIKSQQTLKQKLDSRREQLVSESTELLKLPLKAVLTSVKSTNDVLKLRILKDLEQKNQGGRAKVLEQIDYRIKVLEKAVSAAVGDKPVNETFVTLTELKNLPEVEETEEKSVTINKE